MTIEKIKAQKFPDAPGVYFFLDRRGMILYIGKATSLRDRVRSYFSADVVRMRGPAIAKMIAEARHVKVEKTDSVLEALILEAELIKKHQPRYNSREKDDKSFNYVVITDEVWPRVLLVRGKDLKDPLRTKSCKLKAVYGPFPHGAYLKEALRIIRRIFPFFDTAVPVHEVMSRIQKDKLRFNQEIGVYPYEGITEKEYTRTIRHIQLFFEGKKKRLLRELERAMCVYAREKEFEMAGEMKRQLFGLMHIQDVSLIRRDVEHTARGPFRIEAYDVAHTGGGETVGALTVVQDGSAKKSEYKKFRIRLSRAGDDVGTLRELLLRRFAHPEWRSPDLIVVDGGKAQKNIAEKVVREVGLHIPVVSVVKNEYHRPREILGDKSFRFKHERSILLANSEAHRFAMSYHRLLRGKRFMR